MRIVAGEFRSRVISAVEGNTTRPTTDKIYDPQKCEDAGCCLTGDHLENGLSAGAGQGFTGTKNL